MTQFKSFEPKKFSKHRKLTDDKLPGETTSMKEFCANCGFPYGGHYGINCPTTCRYPRTKLK